MTTHDEKYFVDMLAKIRGELTPQIPSIDKQNEGRLGNDLSSVMAAQKTRDACKKAQVKAKSQKEKKSTSAALAAAEQALKQATDAAIETSAPILSDLQESLLQNDSLDPLLVKCSILTYASKQLADFCKQGDAQSKLVDDLLSNVSLMRDMLYNDGAKGGNYGQAMQIYNVLIPNGDNYRNNILQRLALGTSLEQAVPVKVFGTKNDFIDPIERFNHYKQAYLHRELDPAFKDMTAWECRYISDSDATNEQLAWGRSMLRNYRPDIMELQDYKWRYCLIVRTDVQYCKPNWTSSPHTYDQIISGGGMCGPRAWFGRFACKMFGIPTWGVRQPGHAAAGHWTPNGEWVTCLGAGWKFSYWEGREGLDFVLEAQAREQRKDYIGVCRLEWVADALGEKPLNGKLNAKSTWRSLALLQKHRLANATTSSPTCKGNVNRSIMDWMDRPAVEEKESIIFKDDGTIIIPAVACSMPPKASGKAIFSKSFLGGMQLHFSKDQRVEYTLTLDESRRYNLSIRLVNVHLKMGSLLLNVTTNSGDGSKSMMAESIIPIPYAMGDWQVTDPVEIELGSGTNVLSFARETQKGGLTMKGLTLTPVTDSANCLSICLG